MGDGPPVRRATFGDLVLELVTGDIVAQSDLDAVVNAANAQLQPGGGVAGAIHRAAGPDLAAAGATLAPIEPGRCVVTDAFDLPNRAVLHCLGPVYGRDEPSAELLASCYREALALADAHGLRRVGFPALSTGAFGYPVGAAARVALSSVREVADAGTDVELVRFVLFDREDLRIHAEALDELTAADG